MEFDVSVFRFVLTIYLRYSVLSYYDQCIDVALKAAAVTDFLKLRVSFLLNAPNRTERRQSSRQNTTQYKRCRPIM